ncbi:DUF433 domain-containing protein [Phyllobacterium sp. P30BS-XVII]|uniref:DUF433 domain-containing protein n=1 Tax=Phyllobacterium sp. P30BS-XVII TaxID=2587046 RepID=UPI000DDB925B|nr:DUF433 domain-containing protein [Phyllobacterium sp. P30BS-XVII]MBA8900066.1 uncharacterized protein (DUF433 family) [Phyllobacterium sp. P30BS-XVII]
MKNVIAAFTEKQVERLTGVSVHRLRYWDRTSFFTPSFAQMDRSAPFSRIYSFIDVAALRVLSALIKEYKVPLQHLRKVSQKLGKMDSASWARTTLYVLNKKVIFIDPADGKQREVVSGQYTIGIPLQKILADANKDVQALSQRDENRVGKIEKHRNVSHNVSVVAGTRIPVRSIKNFAEDGYSIEQILEEYPTLTAADIEAALADADKDEAA